MRIKLDKTGSGPDMDDGKPGRHAVAAAPRAGWAEAAKSLTQSGDDALVWPESANDGDGRLVW